MKLIIHAEGDFSGDVAATSTEIRNYLNAKLSSARFTVQFMEVQ